jgi:CIC family chloride channel protein
MAAGVGALFRVPLGGALYATEVLYKENEFESDALMPSFIAAIVSYSVYCPLAGEGWGPLFWMPENLYTVPLQLIFYVVLAFVLAIAGVIFAKFFEFSKFTLFNPKIFPGWTRPAMGGLVLGCIAFFFPYVLGSGYGYLQGALLNEFTIKFCLLLAVLKIIATGVTLGSGNAGGLFAPSLVIGGMLGAVGGMIGQRLGIIDDPSQVVLVGMAGFFGGVSKTPISTLLMVSEMTLGYGLLVPLMTVTALTYLLMPRALSACASQPLNRKDSPAHRGDYIIDILRNLKVSDIVKTSQVPPMVSQETTLSELNMLFTRTNHEAIPVLDADGKMDGILLLSDIKEHLLMLELGGLVVAADISRHDLQPIRLDANASDALGTLFAGGIDELPVVQGEGKTEEDVVGSISRRDIISVYHRQMNQLTKTTADTEMLELSKQTAR